MRLSSPLTVRPILDADGAETGMFEIPAGGRRYRALELLVKQKRLAKSTPIPCIIRTGGIAEEDSLAENVQRASLHPLDQFRALREKGQSSEELSDALGSFDTDSRNALFADCISLTINAVVEPYNRCPNAIAHADRLAQAV